MSNEFTLFEKDEISFTSKFMYLQDLLIINKSTSRMESFFLFGVFYLQILSGFFSSSLGILDIVNSSSDIYLNYFYKIIRLKDLLENNYDIFKYTIIFIFIFLHLLIFYYLWRIYKITKFRFYTFYELVINFMLKIFLFISFNPILDLCLANICFEDKNPNFQDVSCNISENIDTFFLSLINLVYTIFGCIFINTFYNDSQFLTKSFYSRLNCDYEFYICLNNIIYAILLSQVNSIGKEIFLIFNTITSLAFLRFYFTKYLFYDEITNLLVGLFHVIYVWTSFFFLISAYFDIQEKGILYILGIIIIFFLYLNLKNKLENHILMKTPFDKITNKSYIQFYLKTLLLKIHNLDSNIEDKAHLIGIIQTHITECPSQDCLSKKKDKKIYLPITDEWSNRTKSEINDKVFLLNFPIIVMDYFISLDYYSADFLINRSLYYLTILGNYCQAMFYYKKIKEIKLTPQEKFSYERLRFQICKALVEKLKPSCEGCHVLEDLNTTLYFKYEDLSQKFFDEINNDITLSLEFWNSFKQYNEVSGVIDFNKIFTLTNKIRISKNKIENIWRDLFSTYSGVNDLFDLYENYIEQINDDDLLKRELDTLKSKNINSTDHIKLNYYNILFNRETGIIIANGDKGIEGNIKKTNDEIERIFDYNPEELKGMNVSILMPRILEANHKKYMERYFEVGEKRIIDKGFKSYGKDKENSLVVVQLYIKLFPVLTNYIYFCGLVLKENLDDVILIDNKFIIQGISKKLAEKYDINRSIFQFYEIPFYIICKKFVNFFKIFLKGKSEKKTKKEKDSTFSMEKSIEKNEKINEENEEENILENIEINESTELEYEIKIPQFINDYVSSIFRKENNIDIKQQKEYTYPSNDRIMEDNLENLGETENLVDDVTNNSNNITDNAISNLKRFDSNKESDEDKEFNRKILQCKTLFESGKFLELEDLIDKYYFESSSKEYKFNFTFSADRYGDNQVVYNIRCIDNKTDFDYGYSSQSENANPNDKDFTYKHLKARKDALKGLNEVTLEEKKQIIHKSNNYLRMCLEDKEFFPIQVHYKEEMANHSKIFGIKKEEMSK